MFLVFLLNINEIVILAKIDTIISATSFGFACE